MASSPLDMPDTASPVPHEMSTHPIAPRGLSPITELTTPRSIQATLPFDEREREPAHPSYASIREGGSSDTSSVYSQQTIHESGETVTPRPRQMSLPEMPDMPSMSSDPTLRPFLRPSDDDPAIDSPLILPGRVGSTQLRRQISRKPVPLGQRSVEGLPPPPRRKGTPPLLNSERPGKTRSRSWQPPSSTASDAEPDEPVRGSSAQEVDVTSISSVSHESAGQAGIGAGSSLQPSGDNTGDLDSSRDAISPASTIVDRPYLRQSRSQPSLPHPIMEDSLFPLGILARAPPIELLSASLRVSPDATPPLSPAGSIHSKNGKKGNTLRKRMTSPNGRKKQLSGERPRSHLGLESIKISSSASVNRRQSPPRQKSTPSPPAPHQPPSSRNSTVADRSRRSPLTHRGPSRKSLVSSLLSLFDPETRRHRSTPRQSPRDTRQLFLPVSSEERLSVEPQTAVRTSGTFGVRDDGSVSEDPNRSPLSLVRPRTRTESGPDPSALSTATSGLSGTGSAKSLAIPRTLFVQNLPLQAPIEEKMNPIETLQIIPAATDKARSDHESKSIHPSEPLLSASPEVYLEDVGDLSTPHQPGRTQRDVSKGSSTSDHTFGGDSPAGLPIGEDRTGHANPALRVPVDSRTPAQVDKGSTQVALVAPLSLGGPLPDAEHDSRRRSSARVSPTRPLPRSPPDLSTHSEVPLAGQLNRPDALRAHSDSQVPSLVSLRPVSIQSGPATSITPRGSFVFPQAAALIPVPVPTLNVPGPPEYPPEVSRESSWSAQEPHGSVNESDASIRSDQVEDTSTSPKTEEGRVIQAGDPESSSDQLSEPPRALPRSNQSLDSRSRHSLPRAHPQPSSHHPTLSTPTTSIPGAASQGDSTLPLLIASQILSAHGTHLMQQSSNVQDISETIRQMAKESLDWGGILMRLSEESRTRQTDRQRPVSMPQPYSRSAQDFLGTMGEDVPPVPGLPVGSRWDPLFSEERAQRPSDHYYPPDPDPLHDAWLRLHGSRNSTVQEPFAGFPDRQRSSENHRRLSPPGNDRRRPYLQERFYPDYTRDGSDRRDSAASLSREQRARRTQSLEHPLWLVQEADRLGNRGWSDIHRAQEAWRTAMSYLQRAIVDSEGPVVDTRRDGHSDQHPVVSTPPRAASFHHQAPLDLQSSERGQIYFGPPADRNSRGPNPTTKQGSTRASTPSRYGPEGESLPLPLSSRPIQPISPIQESSESACGRPGGVESGLTRMISGSSFLPRAEDMISQENKRFDSSIFHQGNTKARRVLDGGDPRDPEAPSLPRAQTYSLPLPYLRPELQGNFHAQSVGPGIQASLRRAENIRYDDFAVPRFAPVRPSHERTATATSTAASRNGTRRKLRKGMRRSPTSGTMTSTGSGTIRGTMASRAGAGGRLHPTAQYGSVASRGGSRPTLRVNSQSPPGSRPGSRAGSESGHRRRSVTRTVSGQTKKHWWSRRK
ncbi:hypothetical protein BD324DRAFT_218598 [Kockovaella imperatae]|uniref:Uncharacterized protein n=1 Tax=Kockovaella imperatae TaxID=4999 RepID=A0A1Y1U6G5_9TREE|nr:hypothetical protein BD324DRAFT_218598 [Kockovaella imperatae]ORX33608.1 hypothetical protein BD324DRAFT_218598 [Kockovaella imperatae]